jgi:UDP-2-acetamido-3-amino-2,3-dideoxy-glucuronate N-acetyltransferase
MVSPELTQALVHPTASVESNRVGCGSSIGAYSRIGPEVTLGERVTVGERVSIDGRVEIGPGVEIAPDAYLRGPLTVEAGVRIGPRCCMDAGGAERGMVLCEGSMAGAQSTIWPGVTVGRRACIEPGSVVTKNVPAMAVVAGNPAQIVRYSAARPATRAAQAFAGAAAVATEVPGVMLHELPLHEDLRGNLTFGEAQRHVPFEIKRYFLTFAVVSEEVRGEHAHRRLEQFLVCINGRVRIAADDGRVQADFLLERPNLGLYIPPMIWSVQYRFSADAVLLGLCSDLYDPADYIRDYAEFLQLARRV